MTTGRYCYDYPRPALTVDAAVFRRIDGRWRILLIRRARDPFAGTWALPGGFVDMDETLARAAARELEEETGLTGVALEQLHTFGDPGRDPRGRTVSVVHVGIAGDADTTGANAVHAADDAAEAEWHPIDDLPSLAFDHDAVIARAVEWLEERTR